MNGFAQATAVGVALAALLLAPPSQADVVPVPEASEARELLADASLLRERARVAAATVTLPTRSCAGSIVGSPTQVLTAAHCIPPGQEEVDVRIAGRTIPAVVALLDRARDTALLALSEAVPVEPLELDPALPEPGDRILFVGRVDRPSRAQVAKVTNLGRCPSLPGVTDAVFTSVQARPGDSGAPILNEALRVVGVIHGGAACHIAAPTLHLARQLRPGDSVDRPEDSAENGVANMATRRFQFGPFLFEQFGRGPAVRYRLQLRLGNAP